MGWQDDAIVGGAGWQNDPVVGQPQQHGALYNTLFKEGTGGSALASADEGVLPAARDYALAGLDDLTMGAAGAHLPTSVGNMIKQAHSNLGPMDYVEGAAAYGAGPGKVLAPLGKAIGGAGVGGMAAEGALAGGAGSAVSSDDPSLMGIAKNAAAGAALGGGAGLLGKGIQKGLSTPGSIDPDAAITSTEQAKKDAYGQLKNYTFANDPVYNAQTSATVSPGLVPSLSPGLVGKNGLMARQQAQFEGGPVSADDLSHYMQSLQEAADGGSNADKILVGQVKQNLRGILDSSPTLSGHAPGEAGQALDAANQANSQWEMAKNLKQWQGRTAVGGSPGTAPLTQAEQYFQNKPEQHGVLTDLYKQSQGSSPATYAMGHLGANALGAVGGAIGGFPGAFAGEALGYLYLKPAITKAMKGVDRRAMLKAYQQAYPSLTGQQLTGAQAGPNVGDQLKNLAIGGVY